MPVDGSAGLKPENVETYPRPPRLEPVSEVLRIELGGQLVAETDRAIRALETYHAPTYYFPRDDIAAQLVPVSGRTFCEWKGVAQYFDVVVEGAVAKHAAWTYEQPSSTFRSITGYLAFYAGQMSVCLVGDVQVIPQRGDFYGGWVTPNLTGKIKGAPGTRHW